MIHTTRRRLRWVALVAVVSVVIVGATTIAIVALRRDSDIGLALSQLRPGLTQTEVRGLLKPLRADWMITRKDNKGEYLFRGIDELIVVVMDGNAEDACVQEVRHLADTGPWWERERRNWHERFRTLVRPVH